MLIAIAEGSGWGWGSARTVGLFVVAIVFLALWVAQQLRASDPLVDLRLARIPAVLSADVCATILGVAMYMYLSGVSEFVQAPSELGYGFGATGRRRRSRPRPVLDRQHDRRPAAALLDPPGRRPGPAA